MKTYNTRYYYTSFSWLLSPLILMFCVVWSLLSVDWCYACDQASVPPASCGPPAGPAQTLTTASGQTPGWERHYHIIRCQYKCQRTRSPPSYYLIHGFQHPIFFFNSKVKIGFCPPDHWTTYFSRICKYQLDIHENTACFVATGTILTPLILV